MSDEPTAVTTQTLELDHQTAGMLLRKAREAAGLQVPALAAILKVPTSKIEALEADRKDELTDMVFVRALAASMCRALKIDATPVLSRLPQIAVPKFEREDCGISMPERGPNFYYQHLQTVKAFVTKPAFLLVLALLLAASLLYWYPQSSDAPAQGAATEKSTEVVRPAEVSALVKETVMPAPQVTASAPAPAAVPATPLASAPGTVPHPTVAVATDVVVFKAKSSAWIRVTDAKGTVQFEKVLVAGESGSASGVLPLSVTLGNAAATEVLVRGQSFGLEAVTKENVARFEVK